MRRATTLFLLASVLLAGCGGGEKPRSGTATAPVASAADFPSSQGKATLGALIRGLPQGPNLTPGVSIARPGPHNRFGFALFDSGGKTIDGATVALYTASARQTNVRGPFHARNESLAVSPAYRSKTTALDPGSARQVYVADVPFERPGRHVMIALTRVGGRLIASTAIAFDVARGGGPPGPGERAIGIDTPTRDSVRDVSEIDTRIPPDTMHGASLAKVLGRKPVVLVFATPALCRSRVCGPIVDELEELKARYGGRAEFIHMEVFNQNRIERGYRPQFRAWRLPSEPWTFMIDRHGKVVASFEGPASVSEMQAEIERAIAA
jgi:hypothetical protein